MRVFVDTSALVKCFIVEHGSDEVIDILHGATSVLLSVISPIELISGLNRLRREKKLVESDYRDIRKSFVRQINMSDIVDLSDTVIQQSVRCLERTAARTLDAIQIASAKVSKSELFVSADSAQCRAARTMGLKVLLIGKG